MISSVSFETSIGPEYKRNNRSTRQKSLRCFPACGIKGHVTGGFCGLPLKVTLDVTRESSALEFNPDDYRFIAEIRPVSQPRISREKSIQESVLNRQIRSKYEKNEANGEIFQADTVTVLSTTGKQAEVELIFNSQHCSWDYSWKSNRWSGPQEQHVVDIIALRNVSANDIRVVSFSSSPPFVVSSSHKKPVKSNQIKEEEDEENICMMVPASSAKGRRGRSARAEDRDGMMRSGSMSSLPPGSLISSKIVTEKSSNMIGSFGYPWRQQLKVSADGETLQFVRQSGAEKPTVEQESVNEGALALIQLCVSNANPAPAATKKDRKVLSGSTLEDEMPQKKAKSGSRSAESSVNPYPYPFSNYQYPGYPPYPYPYPYPYPPPPGKDGYPPSAAHDPSDAAGSSKCGKNPPPMMYPPPHYPYPPHMYYPPPPQQQGSSSGHPPPGYPPMHMYPYPPPPYGMMPPAPGGGPPPPGMPGMHMPMYYPPMPYPGQYGAPKGASRSSGSSTSGSDTDGEEEGSVEGCREEDGAPIPSSSTAALDLSDDELDRETGTRELGAQSLPVAIPLPQSVLQIPPLDKTVPLVRRVPRLVGSSHATDPNAELVIGSISSAQPCSVFDIIQQRVRDGVAARTAAKAVRAVASEPSGDGSMTP